MTGDSLADDLQAAEGVVDDVAIAVVPLVVADSAPAIGCRLVDLDLFVNDPFDAMYKMGGASPINSGLGFNQRICNEPRIFDLQLRCHLGEQQ